MIECVSTLLFSGSLPRCLQQPGLGRAETRSLEHGQVFLYGWQEPSYPSCHHCLLESAVGRESESRTRAWELNQVV